MNRCRRSPNQAFDPRSHAPAAGSALSATPSHQSPHATQSAARSANSGCTTPSPAAFPDNPPPEAERALRLKLPGPTPAPPHRMHIPTRAPRGAGPPRAGLPVRRTLCRLSLLDSLGNSRAACGRACRLALAWSSPARSHHRQKAPRFRRGRAPSLSCPYLIAATLSFASCRKHRRRSLLFLNGLQIPCQIADSELLVLKIRSVHVTKNRSPHRHRCRAVRWLLDPELQNSHDMCLWKLPMIAPHQRGQISRSGLQRRCCGPRSSPIRSMTGCAVALEHFCPMIRSSLVYRNDDLVNLICEAKAHGKQCGR